jgi:hypothetical protein
MIALPGPDCADAMIAVHRNTSQPGKPALRKIIQATRDKFEFSMKDHPKHDKKEVTLAGVTFKGNCHKCSEQGQKVYECPENIDSGSTINGTCRLC